ncbi:MAG: TMAO reductase system periplasmic protein TorT [Gammaproteobacteria bacterium]
MKRAKPTTVASTSGALAMSALMCLAAQAAHAYDPAKGLTVEAWNPACTTADHEECWNDPKNSGDARKTLQYIPLKPEDVTKKWKLCVSFPHLKDAWWLAQNYGIIDEARRLGVKVNLVEAGGYSNPDTQISQVESCVADGAQAVIMAAITREGAVGLVNEIRNKGIPVIDYINGVATKTEAKSLASYLSMGFITCDWVAQKHAKGSGKVKAAWLPGPPGAGWVLAGEKGCKRALADSDVELIHGGFADTGKEVQFKLVEDVIQAHSSGGDTALDYIIANAPAIEGAVQVKRDRGFKDLQLVSWYITPGMDLMIGRGLVEAAPTDQPVVSARIAVDQAVRILEGKKFASGGAPAFRDEERTSEHIGPKLFMVEKQEYEAFDKSTTLAPKDWKPVFQVD